MAVARPKSFVDQVAAEPGGEKINECIQCGVCSGSCTTAEWWEYPPRKIIAMIRAGMKEEVLSSSSTFNCVSCYLCTVRCPRNIRPANLIHAVETIAEREGYKPKTRTLPLYRSLRGALRHGRVWELGMAVNYYLRTGVVGVFKDLPVALALIAKGRMSLLPPNRGGGQKDVRKIMAKVKEMGGTL